MNGLFNQRMFHRMPTQEFISILAQCDANPCARYGDIVRCKPIPCADDRMWQVEFENGLIRQYRLNKDGVPVVVEVSG